MKIAVLTISYPNLSETFVSREVNVLADRGNEVTVLTMRPPSPLLTPTSRVPVAQWHDGRVLQAIAPDVLYGSLGFPAHQRTVDLARERHLPYLLRVWEGYDAFTTPNPDFYRQVASDPRCLGVVVEDEWMRKYARERMALPDVTVIPNGVDTNVFVPWPLVPWPRNLNQADGVIVLALARFVEKKGLVHLIRAWRELRHPTAILRLVGYGPEEERLRAEAGNLGLNRIEFLPPVPNDDLPGVYQAADIFVAPCITTRTGDADGIPTTVLEAMACGLPVVCSDLLSARRYVEHGTTGFLLEPKDETALARALSTLLDDTEMRTAFGVVARQVACARWSLSATIDQLEVLLGRADRDVRWQAGCADIQARRATRSVARQARYAEIGEECLAVLDVRGDVLDVGCGDRSMFVRLNGAVSGYHGVDVEPIEAAWFTQAAAEALPYPPARFDTVLLYSVLQHLRDPAQALREAYRVLRPGGWLAVQVPVNDPNPQFMSWWESETVARFVQAHGFQVRTTHLVRERYCVINAERG